MVRYAKWYQIVSEKIRVSRISCIRTPTEHSRMPA